MKSFYGVDLLLLFVHYFDPSLIQIFQYEPLRIESRPLIILVGGRDRGGEIERRF